MDHFYELVKKTRSCRRFYEKEAISLDQLTSFVALGRLSASAANLQPLKYILSSSSEQNNRIFPCLGWAGYLKDWPGPSAGERPAAYIILLGDTRISPSVGCDHGIAAQSILLGASAMGLAGCMIGAVKTKQLRTILDLPEHLKIVLVIALGKPKEKIVLDTVPANGKIEYYRDAENVHHVPKRDLSEIIIKTY